MPIRKNKHKASLHKQVSISYGFRFSTALILQRSETERIYMKRASTSKLIWIQTQFCSQNKKAKDLPKISESSTVKKSVNSTVFRLLRKETCEGIYCIINPRGNFSFFFSRDGEGRKICVVFSNSDLVLPWRIASHGIQHARKMKLYTNVVIIHISSSSLFNRFEAVREI